MCDWSTPAETPCDHLSREQAKILRQTLLRLDAEVRVERGDIRIISRLPVGVGTKVGAKTGALGSTLTTRALLTTMRYRKIGGEEQRVWYGKALEEKTDKTKILGRYYVVLPGLSEMPDLSKLVPRIPHFQSVVRLKLAQSSNIR